MIAVVMAMMLVNEYHCHEYYDNDVNIHDNDVNIHDNDVHIHDNDVNINDVFEETMVEVSEEEEEEWGTDTQGTERTDSSNKVS